MTTDQAELSPETLSLLAQLLQATFGSSVALLHYEVANHHADYLVLIAELAYPSLAVTIKLAGPRAPLACPFDRTAALHRLVRAQTDVPLPEVLAVDLSYTHWPWRYMIKSYVRGTVWKTVRSQMNAHELTDAYRQLGHAIAQLHTIQFPAFGEWSANATLTRSTTYAAALIERAQARVKNVRQREWFASLLTERAYLFADVQAPCLAHEDLHPYNIIFHQNQGRWQLSAILDFDSAWAGYHESDLARLELWTGVIGDGFWEAYKAIHLIEESYALRRALYQLLWCLEYARHTPQHLADTRQVCLELGLTPIESFS